MLGSLLIYTFDKAGILAVVHLLTLGVLVSAGTSSGH